MATGSEFAGQKFKKYNARVKEAIVLRKTAAQRRAPQRRT